MWQSINMKFNKLNKIVSSLDPKAFVTLAQGPMVHGGFEKRNYKKKGIKNDAFFVLRKIK